MDQYTFLEPMQRLGYEVDEGGMCFGYGHMASQALFAGEFDVFMERMKFIADTPIDELVQGIKRLKSNPDEKEAQKYVDILAFFDGVALYQERGGYYQELYQSGQIPREQHDIASTAAILMPKKLDNTSAEMKMKKGFSGVYDVKELEAYLKSLQETIAALPKEAIPHPLIFNVAGESHSTRLSYNPDNKEHPWLFIDPNHPDEVYQSSIKETAQKMKRAFFDSEKIILLTSAIVKTSNVEQEKAYESQVDSLIEKWKAHPEWQQIHIVSDEKINFINADGESWLIFEAMHIQDEGNLKKLLEKASPVQVDEVMTFALMLGNQQIIEFMIKEKGIDVVHWSAQGEVALPGAMLAVNENAAKALAELFLSYGVDVNQVNGNGDSALVIAAGMGHNKAINFLVEHGANLKMKNKSGEDALFVAAVQGQVDTVKMLLNTGFNVDSSNAKGETALLGAARNYHPDTIRFLVEHGANIHVKDENGNGVLQHVLSKAIKKGDLGLITFLINKGADVNDIKKGIESEALALKGQQLLSLALKHGNNDVAKALISFGVKVDAKDIALCKTQEIRELAIQKYVNDNDNIPKEAKNVAVKALKVAEHVKDTVKNLDNQGEKIDELLEGIEFLENSVKCMLSMQNSEVQARIYVTCTDLLVSMAALQEAVGENKEMHDVIKDQMERIQAVKNEIDQWEENKIDYSVDGVNHFLSKLVQAVHQEYNDLISFPDQAESIHMRLEGMKVDFSNYLKDCFDSCEDDFDDFIMTLMSEDESILMLLYAITENEKLTDTVSFVDPSEPYKMQVERNGEKQALSLYPLHFALMLDNPSVITSLIKEKVNVNVKSENIKTQEGKPVMPLSIAMLNKNKSVMDELAKCGAKATVDEMKEKDHHASFSLAR